MTSCNVKEALNYIACIYKIFLWVCKGNTVSFYSSKYKFNVSRSIFSICIYTKMHKLFLNEFTNVYCWRYHFHFPAKYYSSSYKVCYRFAEIHSMSMSISWLRRYKPRIYLHLEWQKIYWKLENILLNVLIRICLCVVLFLVLLLCRSMILWAFSKWDP